MSGWEGLRTQAEKQSTAYARMLDLNGGVGMLGVKHPEMFEDMLAWDRISENDHADIVLALLDEIEHLERDSETLINKREELIARLRSFASEAGTTNEGKETK